MSFFLKRNGFSGKGSHNGHGRGSGDLEQLNDSSTYRNRKGNKGSENIYQVGKRKFLKIKV